MENPWLNISFERTVPDCDWYYFALLGAQNIGVIKCDEFDFVTEKIEENIRTTDKFEKVKEMVTHLLGVDEERIKAFVKEYVTKCKLQLNTLPEPYTGDPESNVYLLNMNPGKRDEEFEKVEYNRLKYELLTKLNLSHQIKHSFWYHMKGHDGYSWIRNKTNRLLKKTLYPRFFMIEYFPYHSVRGFEFPQYLPSYHYTDFILKRWLNKPSENKILIIMRNNEKWVRRIEKMETSSFSYAVLNSKQNVSLTEKNISCYGENIDFDDFIAQISYDFPNNKKDEDAK